MFSYKYLIINKKQILVTFFLIKITKNRFTNSKVVNLEISKKISNFNL